MAKKEQQSATEHPAQQSADLSVIQTNAGTPSQSWSNLDPAPSVLLSVSDLAIKHGNTFHRRGKDGGLYPTVASHDSVFKAAHLQADALHGWTRHEFKNSETVRLSDADYLAAVESAKSGKVHAPANKRA